MRSEWVKIKNPIYTYSSVGVEIKVFYPSSGVSGGMDPTVKSVAMTDVKRIYFPSRFDSHVKRRGKKGKNQTAQDKSFFL